MRIETPDDLKRAHYAFLRASSMRGRIHTSGFWDCVLEFLDAGEALGARLWASEDRHAAQSLLTYWSTHLYRAKRGDRYCYLADFDENAPGAFVPTKRVELPRFSDHPTVGVELWDDNCLKVRRGGGLFGLVVMSVSQIGDLISALQELNQ